MDKDCATVKRKTHSVKDSAEEEQVTSGGFWKPNTVVRKHRLRANLLWALALVLFVVYIAIIIVDAIDKRKSPTASIKIKDELFGFPDVALCLQENQGCTTAGADCIQLTSFFYLAYEEGFGGISHINQTGASLQFEYNNPNCKALPLKDLEIVGSPNELLLNLQMLWYHNAENVTDINYHDWWVDLYFLDLDKSGGSKGVVDARLPYNTLNLTTNSHYSYESSDVVMSVREYINLKPAGGKEDPQKVYSHTLSTTRSLRYWDRPGYNGEQFEFINLNLYILGFRFESIEEMDPVDMWAIIGAIGGVWDIICVGFGIFFVYSEKQKPDKKLRNWTKSVSKATEVIRGRHPTSVTFSGVELDVTGEDLPPDWLKKKRPNGSVYYINMRTGEFLDKSPLSTHPLGSGVSLCDTSGSWNRSQLNRSGLVSYMGDRADLKEEDELPDGWVKKTTTNRNTYYQDEINKTTSWERPTPQGTPVFNRPTSLPSRLSRAQQVGPPAPCSAVGQSMSQLEQAPESPPCAPQSIVPRPRSRLPQQPSRGGGRSPQRFSWPFSMASPRRCSSPIGPSKKSSSLVSPPRTIMAPVGLSAVGSQSLMQGGGHLPGNSAVPQGWCVEFSERGTPFLRNPMTGETSRIHPI
ncbi:unnamed protein product [Choristocarpus tenellus]